MSEWLPRGRPWNAPYGMRESGATGSDGGRSRKRSGSNLRLEARSLPNLHSSSQSCPGMGRERTETSGKPSVEAPMPSPCPSSDFVVLNSLRRPGAVWYSGPSRGLGSHRSIRLSYGDTKSSKQITAVILQVQASTVPSTAARRVVASKKHRSTSWLTAVVARALLETVRCREPERRKQARGIARVPQRP